MRRHHARSKTALFVVMLLAGLCHAAVTCGVSTTGVSFGTYDPILGQNRDTSATISVSCTGNTGDAVSYSILLSQGGGTYPSRLMQGATIPLQYNLYVDISRSQTWGDGTAGTSVVSDSYSISTSPTVRDYVVYGRIPSGQTSESPGSFSDTLTITLDY